jgi:ribose 5-phosphate isomerase B
MKIVIGSDKSGFSLKQEIKKYLLEKGIEVEDVGMYENEEVRPYYVSAAMVAEKVSKGEYEKGILCCGTGMGMAIVANKFKGVYASVVEGPFTAKLSKIINNSNVLTMGGWLITPFEAKEIIDNWLNAKFAEGLDFIDENRRQFLENALNEIRKIEDENFK